MYSHIVCVCADVYEYRAIDINQIKCLPNVVGYEEIPHGSLLLT